MTKFRPSTALEAQHELFAFTQAREGLLFLASLTKAPEGPTIPLQRQQATALRNGPTYFVTEDMLKLAMHAAESMPLLPIKPSDLISPSGVCIFEKGTIVVDLHGRDTSICGFIWHPAADRNGVDGVVWSFISDTDDPRDYYMGDRGKASIPGGCPRLLQLQLRFDRFGEIPHSAAETAVATGSTEERAKQNITIMRTLPLCLFVLMGQTIAVTTTERAQRHVRRRLARKGFPVSTIKVVRLRRLRAKKAREGDAQEVDWSHRWIVNGHWRMQPTNDGPKRIWIMPFVKGPEDKALVLKDTVHVLER